MKKFYCLYTVFKEAKKVSETLDHLTMVDELDTNNFSEVKR